MIPGLLMSIPLSLTMQDYLNEMEVRKLEVAREAYTAAVAVAKENQDERSIAAAASARSHLQSLLKQI